ncbi:tRNA nucleotidyltransferase [Talaromyces stipitatus ATCC 10500]|uniref:tRNA nucleotidyltransferase n=2 Tax=Talaromyces stipitatus (strain ATCC 10500 / CBS 375.48 / QM 6759 / NRRL 1006) TaxID=441959 RepID=B8MR06_TALSN|nr:tRNA nucleotidyltransferase [Talaromyces stipitatus ATCC 10500]EED12842.1 tRNA nucleotidyltransferase [Talaromyces stipitatus ATCC 10500]
MLNAHLRPWIPRIYSHVRINCRSLQSCISRLGAYGRPSDHKASSLTGQTYTSSMPAQKRKNTNSDGEFRIRKIKQSKRRNGKMDGTKMKRQTLPTIELTPIEKTIQRLLLDLKGYIEQKEKSEGRTAQEEMVLRFTGGWVRDKLLGVTSHDIDVAISTMTGLQFGTYLQEYLDDPDNLQKYMDNKELAFTSEMLKVHTIKANPEKSKHLETVATKLFGLDIDLVNLRKETYTEHSRNPQVEFGTAEEDALRRDATVNALFYNLNTSMLEDFTGLGLDDMERKLIRTPLEPYQTFKDDPLRVLRLIRFASRLGYHIDEKTQEAMQNDDIKRAFKLKISKERVGVEVEKTLRAADPRIGLRYIDDLGLYSTIFANQYDDAEPHVASWSLAYDALDHILSRVLKTDELRHIKRIKNILIRNEDETFYAWVMAAFTPWVTVPERVPTSRKQKPPIIARAAEVARDNLRMENKIVNALKDATALFKEVSSLKSSVISKDIPGTAAEVRQHVGLQIRSWKKDWRLIVLMAMLQEISAGVEPRKVFQEYDAFLSYLEKEDLLEVSELRPIANGKEVSTAFGLPDGKWLSSALDMLISWQLLHPHNADKNQALEELKSRRAELGV